jgi:hypothetical protein
MSTLGSVAEVAASLHHVWLTPYEQASSLPVGMSQMCHKRTLHPSIRRSAKSQEKQSRTDPQREEKTMLRTLIRARECTLVLIGFPKRRPLPFG